MDLRIVQNITKTHGRKLTLTKRVTRLLGTHKPRLRWQLPLFYSTTIFDDCFRSS
jgi:hypothetical protein